MAVGDDQFEAEDDGDSDDQGDGVDDVWHETKRKKVLGNSPTTFSHENFAQPEALESISTKKP